MGLGQGSTDDQDTGSLCNILTSLSGSQGVKLFRHKTPPPAMNTLKAARRQRLSFSLVYPSLVKEEAPSPNRLPLPPHKPALDRQGSSIIKGKRQ